MPQSPKICYVSREAVMLMLVCTVTSGWPMSLEGCVIWVAPQGSAPGEEEHRFCGLCLCLGHGVGFLSLRVNFPTGIACLSWVARLPFWKQTWWFHGFCWAIVDNFISYHSALSSINCLISCYLLPNNDFWMCRIPQTIFPQLAGLRSPPPHETPPPPLGCQDDHLALLSPRLVPLCLEFGMTANKASFALQFNTNFILILTSGWIQANGKKNCHIL